MKHTNKNIVQRIEDWRQRHRYIPLDKLERFFTVIICLLIACYLFVLYNAWTTKKRISFGQATTVLLDNAKQPSRSVDTSSKTYKHAIWLRHYLDSLHSSPKDSNRYHAILQQRPGLLDSLCLLETLLGIQPSTK